MMILSLLALGAALLWIIALAVCWVANHAPANRSHPKT